MKDCPFCKGSGRISFDEKVADLIKEGWPETSARISVVGKYLGIVTDSKLWGIIQEYSDEDFEVEGLFE